MTRVARRSLAVMAAAFLIAPAGAQMQDEGARKPPYWVSIATSKARTRTGPGRNYPAIWLYQRTDLPVRVVETFPSWRKIEDPDGAQGWVMVNLLSDRRTGMIVGGRQLLRKNPGTGERVVWEVEPGVVGRISKCTTGWCRFDAGGKAGFVEMRYLWGVSPGEVVE